MKAKKILSLALVLVFIVVCMTACWPASVADEMTITSDEGAGSRVFHMRLFKDGADKLDGDGKVANMFGDADASFFPSGIEPVLEYLNEHRPEAVPELTMTETDEYYDLSYTITFTSIADFNAKCKAIAGDNWGDTQEATLTFENAEGGKKGIYTEDKELCFAVSLWGSQALFEAGDNTLFNMDYVASQYITTPDQVLQNDQVTISVNGTKTVYKYEEDQSDDKVIVAEGLFEGSVPTSAPTETTTTTGAVDSNPSTGENAVPLLACAGLAVASLVCIACARRLSYKK